MLGGRAPGVSVDSPIGGAKSLPVVFGQCVARDGSHQDEKDPRQPGMDRQDREDQQATTHDETEGLNPRASPIGVAAPLTPVAVHQG